MFQKKLWLHGLVLFGLGFAATVQKSIAQTVFRVGVWCPAGDLTQPSLYYLDTIRGIYSIKGAERDKMLNLGLNYALGCMNFHGENAMVFMGDSLDSAPVRKEFKTTLKIVPPCSLFSGGYEIRWLAVSADVYQDSQQTLAWRDSVRQAYTAMHTRHATRIDGVHSFFAAEEGCINTANHIPGINYMCNHSIIDAFVQLGYVQTPNGCHTITTYDMAKGLHRAAHLMSGNYILQQNPFTPYTGPAFQARIDLLVGSLADARRGIRDADTTSNATFWSVLQTQQSTNPQINLRLPTRAEILCFVNLSLAYGAKGITYYPYSTLVATGESGLLNINRDTTAQYNNVRAINTNYQGTGQSLVTIGGNFLNLTWRDGFTIHRNLNEPISNTYDLYDVTARPPGGANDPEDSTYVEIGILQDASNVNHYMVVNRRCTSSETREITLTFECQANRIYRVTNVYTGGITNYYVTGRTTFPFTLTLGPGEGRLLKVEDLGPWEGD
ncbi:MAG: hypothetical protein ONB44_19905 [candidate division KSB1 bacterium]|nr:hypothetical protein [candidate division KSB1 bacterium]MDZ7304395.1 hypothetical protein [candidate division KSB1 bacterium]MDZ7313345.1 hypothetical protein [candidate division KSB1 bacterium]